MSNKPVVNEDDFDFEEYIKSVELILDKKNKEYDSLFEEELSSHEISLQIDIIQEEIDDLKSFIKYSNKINHILGTTTCYELYSSFYGETK